MLYLLALDRAVFKAAKALGAPTATSGLDALGSWWLRPTKASKVAEAVANANAERQKLTDLAKERLTALHEDAVADATLLQHNPHLAGNAILRAEETGRLLQTDVTSLANARAALPKPVTLPPGTRLSILRHDVGPDTKIDFALRAEDGVPMPTVTAADITIETDNGELPHFVVRPSRTTVGSVSIVFVLDCSTSMQGERFQQAKTALESFTREMSASGRLQLVTFADRATAATPLTTDRQLVLDALTSVRAEGQTELTLGLDLAIRNLELSAPAGRSIIVCTDGQDPKLATAVGGITERCRNARISVHVLGINDASLDQDHLRQLAGATQGLWTLAEQPNAIARKLDEILGQLTIASYRLTALNPSSDSPLTLKVAGLTAAIDRQVQGQLGNRTRPTSNR
jgi:uncharacterized protein YegL